MSGLAAACGVPASAISLSHLNRGQASSSEESGLLPAGAPAAAVGPSATATAAPSEPLPRPPPPPPLPPPLPPPPPPPPPPPLPPPPPPEGFTGIFVAGDAAPTAGADAAPTAIGEFREVDLRRGAFRDLRGPFEVGEIGEMPPLVPEISSSLHLSSLHLSACISLPSRNAAEATAGWLESAVAETIAEAVGPLHPPSPPATNPAHSPINPAHSPAPSLSPAPSPHANPHPSSTRWATR